VKSTEQSFLESYLAESAEVMQVFAREAAGKQAVAAFADVISSSLENGGKLLVAGNGGSAADAQHIAGEIVSRLFFDRPPLAAVALTTDTSVLTAIGNDYGYETVFERQLLGLGNSGDVFLAISTSGKSPNILRALAAANAKGIVTLGFTGVEICPMDDACDHILHAPSAKTSVIQQIHITAAHLICGLVERRLCAAG
jgi:D-sedoheptulose 7-phosphate isomerase